MSDSSHSVGAGGHGHASHGAAHSHKAHVPPQDHPSAHSKPKPGTHPNVFYAGVVVVALILGFLVVSSYNYSPAQVGPPTQQITIQAGAFHPDNASISAGTVVTWVNNDPATYDVVITMGPDWFDSKALASGSSFSWQFNNPGYYQYAEVHYGFTGNLNVTNSSN